MDDVADVSARARGRRSVRQNILRAAMDLFAKEGSRGTSLAAIAERIGVTTPAITHHFGTKHELIIEVVEHFDKLVENKIDIPEAADGRERLTANRHWAQLLVEDEELAGLSRLATVITTEALDPDFAAHDHILARHRHFRQLLTELVLAGQRDGSIRADVDPKTVAAEVIAFMQGAQVHWFLDPADVPIRQIFDAYFSRLERDLAS